MKWLSLILFSFCAFFNTTAQDVNAVIKVAERLENIPNEKAALEKFKEAVKLQPSHVYALSRCSELCSRIGLRQQTPKQRDEFYQWAKKYAGAALKINPHSSDANCVMAIALGRIALSKSNKEKLSSAKAIKRYADSALKYDPSNYKAWHVLGKWHYELSILNFVERAAAKILFGGVPKASIKESIHAYEKAKSLSSNFILNYFEMAKAYKEDGQDKKAIAALNTLLLLPNKTEDDPFVKLQAKKLLKSWQ
jgi:tetratricopeptide (TPR) repeat protein